MRRTGSTRWTLATAAGVSLAVLTACGSTHVVAQVQADVALKSAADKVAVQRIVDATVSISGAPGDLATLLAKGRTPTNDERDTASTLQSASVEVETDRGDLKNPADDLTSLTLKNDGQAVASVVVGSRDIYARLSRVQLNALAPQLTMRMLDGLGAQLDAAVPHLGALFQGRWVHAAIPSTLLKQGGAKGPTSSMTSSLGSLLKKATISKDPADGNHLVATIAVADVEKSIASGVAGLGTSLPTAPSTVKSVHLDIYLSNGSLSRISLDLGQFRPGVMKGHVAVVITLSGDTAPVRPTGAVTVDLSRLVGLLPGLGAGAVGSGA